MSASTIFFILIVAVPLAMMLMGRGGSGMGCCGGHSQNQTPPAGTPRLGPPGSAADTDAPEEH